MDYHGVLFCIFHKKLPMSSLCLMEIGKFPWECREKEQTNIHSHSYWVIPWITIYPAHAVPDFAFSSKQPTSENYI